MRYWTTLVLASGFALAQPGGIEEGKAALMQADREFSAEAARRGPDGFADWFATTRILKFRGKGAPLATREEVRADMKKSFEGREFNLKWEPVKADIAASGDLGYTYGTWTAGNARGHYLTIWKKQSGGNWKVVVDFGNPD